MNTVMNQWAPLPPGQFPAYAKGQPMAAGQPASAEPQAPKAAETTQSTPSSQKAAQSFDVDALVDQLWGFMRGRLAEAQASGVSESEMDTLWQSAKQGLEQGFDQAKDVLTSVGKMSDPLEEKIDNAYTNLTGLLEDKDLSAEAPKTQVPEPAAEPPASRQINIYQYQEQTFSLNVKTQEGDSIRVRVSNRMEAGAEGQMSDSGSSIQWGRRDSNAYSLQIEGDLNETERADLDKLLGEVNTLANEFYDGDLNVAWEQAQALSIDGSSLASMNLNMREVEAKGVSAYRQEQSGTQSLPKGLGPLRQYAQDMLVAQQDWLASLNSRDGLSESLANHPRNDGGLAQFARELLGA